MSSCRKLKHDAPVRFFQHTNLFLASVVVQRRENYNPAKWIIGFVSAVQPNAVYVSVVDGQELQSCGRVTQCISFSSVLPLSRLGYLRPTASVTEGSGSAVSMNKTSFSSFRKTIRASRCSGSLSLFLSPFLSFHVSAWHCFVCCCSCHCFLSTGCQDTSEGPASEVLDAGGGHLAPVETRVASVVDESEIAAEVASFCQDGSGEAKPTLEIGQVRTWLNRRKMQHIGRRGCPVPACSLLVGIRILTMSVCGPGGLSVHTLPIAHRRKVSRHPCCLWRTDSRGSSI